MTVTDFMLWREKLLQRMLETSKNEMWARKKPEEVKANINNKGATL